MSIRFRICWIENQPDDVEGALAKTLRLLRKQHLRPEVEFIVPAKGDFDYPPKDGVLRRDVEDVLKEIPRLSAENFDLYIIDFNTGRTKGDEIANAVRQHVPYGAIVFYSASERVSLRRRLHDREIDGVFTSSRDDLPLVVSGLVENMFARTSVTAMRGHVVAGVAEHDILMIQSITTALSALSQPRRRDALEKAVNRIEKRSKKGVADMRAAIESDDVGFIVRELSTVHRWYALKDQAASILKNTNGGSAMLDKLGTFETEVVIPRNKFAHATRIAGSQFNDLRKAIFLHHENFERILEEITASSTKSEA